MNTKKCNKCQLEKPLTDFYRRKYKSGWGTRPICIECWKRGNQEYKQRPDRMLVEREYNQQHYIDNKEHIDAINRQYRLDHKEELTAKNRQYYEDHKEELRAKSKEYCHRPDVAKRRSQYSRERNLIKNGPGKYKNERRCRQLLEDWFHRSFPKSRPAFLRHPETGNLLELDGFCEELKLAFEYDGEQHYHVKAHFKRSMPLEERQRIDALKNDLCRHYGIILIRVPYWENKRLAEFLREELIKRGITVNE